MQMAGELGAVLSQVGKAWLRADRVQEGGDELTEQPPRTGPGQAVMAGHIEASNAAVIRIPSDRHG
jgi:hypothetical protein